MRLALSVGDEGAEHPLGTRGAAVLDRDVELEQAHRSPHLGAARALLTFLGHGAPLLAARCRAVVSRDSDGSPKTSSSTAFTKSRRGELNPGPADYESDGQ